MSKAHDLPCIVDLSTGEIGELSPYDPNAAVSTGTFSFVNICGLTGYRDTSQDKVQVDLPDDTWSMNTYYLCITCRISLWIHGMDDFALVDLYAPGSPRFLPLIDGASYELRGCQVSITASGQGGTTVAVTKIPES